MFVEMPKVSLSRYMYFCLLQSIVRYDLNPRGILDLKGLIASVSEKTGSCESL